MSTTDKAKHTAQHAKGKVKEGVGHMTGNERLEAEGQRDQIAADAKKAGDRAKETVKHGAESAKGKVKEGVGKVTDDDSLTAEGKTEQEAAKLKEKLNK